MSPSCPGRHGPGVVDFALPDVMGVLVTMDAEQGVEAMRIIDPDTVIPIHYDDYDVFTSSLQDFVEAAEQAGLRNRLHPLRREETYRLS